MTKDLQVVAKVPKKQRKTVKIDLGTAVKTEVKKQMSKAIENKYSFRINRLNESPGTDPAFEWVTPSIPLNSSFRALLPAITEGTDGNQRLGKSIVPKCLKVRVTCSIGPAIIQSMVRHVRFMFLTNKSVKDQLMLTTDGTDVPNYAAELLWNGKTATPDVYKGGQPYYNHMPINRKQWNVLKVHDVVLAKSLSVDSNTPDQKIGAITSQYSHTFEVVLECPAKLHYDGGNTTEFPSNFAPIMAIGWIDPSGVTSSNTENSPQEVQVQWTSSLTYEDA